MKHIVRKLTIAATALIIAFSFFACAPTSDEAKQYSVTVEKCAGGAITYSCEDKTITDGSKVTVTVTPDEHYEIEDFFLNGEKKTLDASGQYVVVVQGKDVSLKATFREKQYKYTASVDGPDGGSAVFGEKKDGKVGYSVNADEHYEIVSVLLDSKEIIPEGAFRLQTLNGSVDAYSNHELTAKFSPVRYKIIVDEPLGAVTADKTEAVFGEKVTVSVRLPSDGKLISLKINGAEQAEKDKSEYEITVTGDVAVTAEIDCRKFTITAYGDDGIESVTLSRSEVPTGGQVTVEAIAKKGYEATEAFVGKVRYELNNGQVTIENITENVTVSVVSEKKQYVVEVIGGEGGTLSASKEKFYYGDKIVLYVTEQKGYALTALVVNGENVEASDGSATLEGYAEDVTVQAFFEKEVYSVSVARSVGGTIKADKTSYSVGDRISFEITPDRGYRLKRATVNGSVVTVTDNAFVLPSGTTGNVSAYAEFEKIVYYVKTSATGSGNYSCNRSSYLVGDDIVVTYSCEQGYDAYITVNGTEMQGENGTLTLRDYAENLDITIKFDVRRYTVTVNASEGGDVVVTPRGKVAFGSTVTAVFSPESGYEVRSVTVNGNKVQPVDNRITVENVQSDVIIDVVFAKIEYSFIAEQTEGGKIQADKQKFTSGEKVTITFVPDDGYKFDSAYLGGLNVTDKVKDGTLVLTVGNSDLRVSAVFVSAGAKTYRMTSSLNAKYGEVVFNPPEVAEGGTAVFVVNMNEGYSVAKVSVAGVVIAPENGVYYYRDVKSDLVVDVQHDKIAYSLSVENNAHASITAPAEYTIEDVVNVTVQPEKGYVVVSVSVGDRVLVPDGNGVVSYSGFGNVTVSALVEEGRYSVTLKACAHASASLSDDVGGISKPVTLTATANDGYAIVAVSVGGVRHAFEGGTFEISGVRENTEVEVITDYAYYTIRIINYFEATASTTAGEVTADKSSYTIDDVVTFTVVERENYHLSSITINYVDVTDSFVGGTYRYSGKGNVVLIANFEVDSLDIRGVVVNQKGEKIAGARVTVENQKGEIVDELTTYSNGRFTTKQNNGEYVITAQASGYQYTQSVTVSGKNEIKEIELKVVQSQFADVAQFTEMSYDFDKDGETVVVDGNAKAVNFTVNNTGTFAASFTVKNQMSTSDPNREAEPGVGIVVSGGGNTFTCQFVRNSSRIIINGDWGNVPYGKNLGLYNLNNPGAEQQFLFVKSGNSVVFYALDKQGNYKTVMAYEDERFSLAYTYAFYITKKDSTKTLNMKLSNLKTYDSLSTLSLVKASLETVEGVNGSVVVDNHSDGCYLSGKKYRVYGIPDEGKKLSSIWVDGSPVEFTPDGKDSGYVTITAGENRKVQAVFTSDAFDDGAGYGNYDYDKTLFYRNDLVTNGADPGVMFVSKEEDPVYGGWFYMTVTSSMSYERKWSGDGVYYRSAAYNCYRSKNLSDWELVGAIDGYALGVRPEEWAYDAYWAPEMIRDKKTGKYFLYFSARSKIGNGTNYSSSDKKSLSGSGQWDRLYLGIAMSDTPIGPYKLVSALDYNAANGVPNKNTNANGEVIDGNVVPINFAKNIAAVKNKGYDFWPAIDVSPFVDEDGTLYLYFSQHMSSASYGNSIWMMKMKDMITPDYSTMRMVSLPGYTDVTSVEKGDEIYFNSGNINYNTKYKFTRYSYDGDEKGNGINEGVNVIKDYESGKYYLTYSPFGYGSRRYSIMQAVSDSPYGPFHKLPAGVANPVLGIYNKDDSVDYGMSTDLSASIDYISGTGHHCFVRAGDEIFAVYHAFYNPVNNKGNGSFMGRRIAADRIYFTYNSSVGCNVLYGNGPTDTLQNAPAATTGYANVTGEATVTATNANGNTIQYLSDGLFVLHNSYQDREFVANGDSVITLDFAAPKKLRAVMLYSSAKYAYALKKVSEIKLTTSENRDIVLRDVVLNPDYYRADKKTIHYGGAIIADFSATLVKKVTITVKSEDKLVPGGEIRISDLVVLGEKNAAISSDNAKYSTFFDLYAEDGIRVDGRPNDNAWKNAKTYEFVAGGVRFEAKAVRGAKGAYFLVTAYDKTVVHSDESGNTYKMNGLRRFYKNTGWQLKLYAGSGAYSSSRAVSVTADAYSYIVNNSKRITFATYVNGTVNGLVTSFAFEAYVPYDQSGGNYEPTVSAEIKYRHVEGNTATVNTLSVIHSSVGNVLNFEC